MRSCLGKKNRVGPSPKCHSTHYTRGRESKSRVTHFAAESDCSTAGGGHAKASARFTPAESSRADWGLRNTPRFRPFAREIPAQWGRRGRRWPPSSPTADCAKGTSSDSPAQEPAPGGRRWHVSLAAGQFLGLRRRGEDRNTFVCRPCGTLDVTSRDAPRFELRLHRRQVFSGGLNRAREPAEIVSRHVES